MAEEEGEKQYIFITENQEKKSSSRGYNGKAVAHYPNDDKYEGQYINGIREGHGIYYYANGEKYDGEWSKNRKHGIGRMFYYKNGAEDGNYNGFWENGRRHGEGVFHYKNGDIYSGWWKHGEKEGTGTYTFKSTGMKLFGEREEGSIKNGKWIYPNGMFYEGQFDNNKPKGQGKWVFKNGNTLEGEYEQKEKVVGEDEEPPAEEEGEDAVKKPKFNLVWHSNSNITESAHCVNSVE